MGFGIVPSCQQLKNAGIQAENASEAHRNIGDQPPKVDSMEVQDKLPEGKSQLFLAAPGLPTVPMKLAQRIWDLDFIEMEEFLPSNWTVQAL